MRLSQLRCVACVAPVSVVRGTRNRTMKCISSPTVSHEGETRNVAHRFLETKDMLLVNCLL
jgi:hypothetical protein